MAGLFEWILGSKGINTPHAKEAFDKVTSTLSALNNLEYNILQNPRSGAPSIFSERATDAHFREGSQVNLEMIERISATLNEFDAYRKTTKSGNLESSLTSYFTAVLGKKEGAESLERYVRSFNDTVRTPETVAQAIAGPHTNSAHHQTLAQNLTRTITREEMPSNINASADYMISQRFRNRAGTLIFIEQHHTALMRVLTELCMPEPGAAGRLSGKTFSGIGGLEDSNPQPVTA